MRWPAFVAGLVLGLGWWGVAAAHDASAEPAASAAAAAFDPLAGRFGGPFTLTDQNGRAVSDTDFRGRFMLVYFGYTHCVDTCPVDLAIQHKSILDLGEAGEAIDPIFVTVDPARDTPAVLGRYAAGFHPRQRALTGTEPEIAAVAKAYRVHRRKVGLDHPDAEGMRAIAGAYIVDHGPLTFLMGPDGNFLTLIPTNTTPQRMTEILRTYVGAGG